MAGGALGWSFPVRGLFVRSLTPFRFAALALLAALVAARLGLHPNTPYKGFLLSLAAVAGGWLALAGWAQTVRQRIILAVTAIASVLPVAVWCFRTEHEWQTTLRVAWAVPALIGVWLGFLLVAALLTGALNKCLRHGPMTALGFGLVVYALASGYLPLPWGAAAMTAGMLWMALWQALYLYRVRLP